MNVIRNNYVNIDYMYVKLSCSVVSDSLQAHGL